MFRSLLTQRHHVRLLCLAFVLVNATACQTTSIDSIRDGRSTWRSDQLEMNPGGGRIHVNVVCDSNEPVTVVLLSETSQGSAVGPDSSRAAASGVTRNGMFLVRFLDLPAAGYMVIAFSDRIGDGRLEERIFAGGAEPSFTEPHSTLKRFMVREGDICNVSLELDMKRDNGGHDS